ncbi:MAG TPA: phosphatase PAP2 family protein [Thermoclostridium sp.]|nr:phosphatase PAP2 family protein [Thermoclostridium sp.]
MQKVATWIQLGDIIAFFFFNKSLKNPVTDRLMPLLTKFGGSVWSITITIILLINRTPFWHNVGIYLGASLFASNLIVHLFKKVLPRPRPYLALNNVVTGSKLYKDASFPSGHSTASFCIATVFSKVIPSLSLVFFIVAVLVAISRVYLGLHYPSDVAIGAVLGVVTVLLIGYFNLI